MDDPRVAFPVFEETQQLGVNLIGVHKGVPLGPQPVEHTRTFDMDGAAANFPDINFIIFHVGLPWLDEVLWQLVRYPNLYASIAATVNFISRHPRVFADQLAKMLWWCGEDKIIYGGEAPIWHPQWALEAFWNFALPEGTDQGLRLPAADRAGQAQNPGRQPRPPARDRRSRPRPRSWARRPDRTAGRRSGAPGHLTPGARRAVMTGMTITHRHHHRLLYTVLALARRPAAAERRRRAP